MADRVLVVFNDKDGIAQVAELLERMNQPGVVALVESDGWFVENVQNAAKARADLRGEADALAFAAGKRGRAAIKREIAESHRAKEFQPLLDLAADAIGDKSLARRELEVDGCRERAIQRQRGE